MWRLMQVEKCKSQGPSPSMKHRLQELVNPNLNPFCWLYFEVDWVRLLWRKNHAGGPCEWTEYLNACCDATWFADMYYQKLFLVIYFCKEKKPRHSGAESMREGTISEQLKHVVISCSFFIRRIKEFEWYIRTEWYFLCTSPTLSEKTFLYSMSLQSICLLPFDKATEKIE